jgi:hypothetical protein
MGELELPGDLRELISDPAPGGGRCRHLRLVTSGSGCATMYA